MPSLPELLQITPTLWIWQAFDPAVKSDLFATAVQTGHGLFLIDPIPLPEPFFQELTSGIAPAAILVTNANHSRAAAAFGQPIFGAARALEEFEATEVRTIPEGGEIASGVTAIPIDGAVPGEVAFHFADDGGTMVVGDALINFEPYGFSLLPPKYCSDQREMRRSLRQLLDCPWQRLLFAHGTPILSGGREPLEILLR